MNAVPETHTEPMLLRVDADGVRTLTLNRPGQFNALSRDMLEALLAELEGIAADKSVRVVVLAGAGKAFCAGHDLKEMRGNYTNQSKSVSSGGKSLEAMHQLKTEAKEMKEALLFGNIDRMADILRSGWEAKKRTSASVSTPEVEKLFEVAMNNGAKAGKLSGAGGGGFALFMVDPDDRPRLEKAIAEQTNANPNKCNLTNFGVSTWAF